ncbi:MAG: hypothetical protein KDK07_25935 [Bauldia sp.]|nr:hypothetical protein [Bauldia sp.]
MSARPWTITAAAIALAAFSLPGLADEAANKLAVEHLYAGTLAAGDTELAAILAADPKNDDARIGLGTIRFVRSIENLSQGLYRYGLKTPRSFLLPILRLPVPENPNPETLRFEDFQALIAGFSRDLALAEETLVGVGPDVKLRLDLRKVHYDIDGDGKVLADESFIAVMQQVTGMPAEAMPAELTFAFDQGDALWLRGYCHVMMGFSDFIVAHDWHESFDAAFHHFFPRTDSPFAAALTPPDENFPMYAEGAPVADFVSFFHIRWPVSDPALMAGVRQHIKAMIALSRESWNAIEAETDDDLEWLPNAHQKSPFASVQVSADQIAAWRSVLDQAELVIDGKKLVPHWRFDKGFNLARVFDEPQPFDTVLWVTGPAALPYLEDGPVSTSEDWQAMVDTFGGRFGIFAVWFN